MSHGVNIKKGELVDLLNVMREKYGDLKLSNVQEKISSDENFESVAIYHSFLGVKKIKVFSKGEGIVERIKKKGKNLENIKIEKR